MRKLLIGFICILLLSSTAQAHYLWAVQENGVIRIARGLPPAQFDSYPPPAVKEIKALDVNGNSLSVQRVEEQDQVRVRVASPPALVTVFCEWGHRVITPEGKKFLTKQAAQKQGLQVQEAFSSSHFSKTIFTWSEAGAKPTGLDFEIVPQKNPLALKPGEDLPLQVRWQGSPLPGCRVRATKVTDLLETDKQGMVHLRFSERGLTMVHASHRVTPADTAEIDYQIFTTFLSFTLP
ncbi:MAG: DUF4198 domain-containing protein [Desulfobacteraceae bacterium]